MKYLFPVVILFIYVCASFDSVAQEPIIEGELIIHLQHLNDMSELEAEFTAYSLEAKRKLSPGMNIWLVSYDKSQSSSRLLTDLQEKSNVVAAQFNHRISQRNTPNDPDFNQLWGLNNTGQIGGTNDADIDAIEAWDTATGGLTVLGDTIVVAVIDGGFDLNHEDLNFYKNNDEIPFNGIDDDNNGYIDDINGWNAYDDNGNVSSFGTHGTHVAGTVGAIGNNNIGITGVNWGVEVMAISGSSGDEATVVAAYAYVLQMRKLYNQTNRASGAYVVATNSSFGVNNANPANYPIWCAMYDSMGKYGVISAGATMNNNSNVDVTGDVPTACASSFLITVTNTTQSDNINNGAAFGATTIDLGAPGTGVLSTVPGNGYNVSSGTSMATPHVAGSIGLLYSGACESFMSLSYSNPDSAALLIKNYILSGVDPIADLATTTTSGGRLNIGNSMTLLQGYNCETCDYSLSYGQNDIACFGDDNGVIDLMFSGASANLIFQWSNGSVNEDLIGLSGGSYTVTVSDTSGCTRVQSVTIKEPAVVEFNSVDVTPINNGVNGSILLVGQGGASGFTYSIDGVNFQTSGYFDNLTANTYTLTVKDANDCSRDTVVTMIDITGIGDIPDFNDLKLYPIPASDVLQMSFVALDNQDYRFTIFNTLGQAVHEEVFTSQAYKENLKMIKISSLASGTYYLSITDENGLMLTKKFLID